MPEIATFVFFDLETTGLPCKEMNRTKITEISLVAASRKSVQRASYGKAPKVSKLTLLLNPQRPISRSVEKLNGLTNEMLDDEPTFYQKFEDITFFLENLPKPVCLVAHNGNRFDFPIFLAEFNDIEEFLPANLFCADSLVGFKSILKGTNLNYQNLKPQSTDDEDSLDSDDDSEGVSSDNDCQSSSDEMGMEFWKKQKKVKTNTKKVAAKKTSGFRGKESFKLSDLYKRLLNKNGKDAHRAEADCLMLAECVVAVKDKFLQWADKNCTHLDDIKPLYRR